MNADFEFLYRQACLHSACVVHRPKWMPTEAVLIDPVCPTVGLSVYLFMMCGNIARSTCRPGSDSTHGISAPRRSGLVSEPAHREGERVNGQATAAFIVSI